MKAATLKIDIWTGEDRETLPADCSDLAELFAPHLEYIAGLCSQGYQCGQVVDERFSGWWKIEEGAAE